MTGAVLSLLIAFALAVLYLRYVALPNVESWRPRIVGTLESASGMVATMRSIEGGWDGLRPSITLHGFALADRRGRAALAFERAEFTLAWHALLLGELRFHEVEFDRPELILRRGADGALYLADKPLGGTAPGEDDFTGWLLAQPRLLVHDARLTWRDEFAKAPEVKFSNVEIAVLLRAGRHRLAILAVPPPHLSGRIDLRADLAFERKGERWSAAGEIYGEALHTDLGRLRTHLPVPETLRSGAGSLRLWAGLDATGVREVTADINLRDARAQFATDALPLDLAAVSGRARYRAQPGGFFFGTEGLNFRTASGMDARTGSFSILREAAAGQATRGELKADGIDLKIAAALLDYFPVPQDLKREAARFAPRGLLGKASLAWTGDSPAEATKLALRAGFKDLGINASNDVPGFSGLTGEIEGTELEGRVRLDSKDAVIDASAFLRAPVVLDALEASGGWKRVDGRLEVRVGKALFANADAQGEATARWHAVPDSAPGYLELKGTLARAKTRSVARYLPHAVAGVRPWLQAAILAGDATRASFEVKGELRHFPFAGGKEGLFLIEGDFTGGGLRYHPEWPTVDAIEGTLRFEGVRMEIRADRAAIFSSRVKSAVAVIEDLGAEVPILTIAGEVDAVGTDAHRFLRESPLAKGPGAFTRAVLVSGPAHLGLKLRFPLSGPAPATVAGELAFAGVAASAGKSISMSGIRGRLSFTESGVRAPELTGTLFGQGAVLRIGAQGSGPTVATLEGRIAMPVLGAWIPEPFASRMDGGLDWRARVVPTAGGTDLLVESDLRGLSARLPAPLNKFAGDARPLNVTIRDLGGENELTTATLGGGIYGRFGARGSLGAERWHAALKFGGPVGAEPVRDGVWLYGHLDRLDLDAWQEVFATRAQAQPSTPAPAAAHAALELRGIDLRLDRASFTKREFSNVSARLERDGAQWSGTIDSPNVAGNVSWDPAGRGRVKARLSHFVLKPQSHADTRAPDAGGDDLPALDIVAERFDFKGNTLGRLELQAEHSGAEWRIDRMDITQGPTKFAATGVWRRTGTGSLTELDTKLETGNLNALFAQFGYGDYVKRGQGSLEGKLVWPGFPYEFALANLSGSFRLAASRGQFAKIEPGAGKLLGLLSLQSLPQRITLDFRDVFTDGFAFDRIGASVKVARGILLTSDFELSGPSAFVSISGEVSLPDETQSLILRVVPEVGESVALAATVFGTPVLGLSTLLLSKLLSNPFGKVVAYEYRVVGTWDNPGVTPVSVPPRRVP